MRNQGEIDDQLALLTTHRRRLSELLKQQALYGGSADPHITLQISDERQHIARIKAVLQEWNVVVEDHPDDVEQRSAIHGHSLQAATRARKSMYALVAAGALVLVVVVVIAFFWFRMASIHLSRLEFRRNHDTIHAFLSADSDLYALVWGSDGTPSGSIGPWSSSQQPALLQGVRDLNLFKDVTDPSERMWFRLTLMRGSTRHEYQVALHMDGDAGLVCDPTLESQLIAIAPCVFADR